MSASWLHTAARNPGWRRCADHPGVAARWVCEGCRIGLCEQSVKMIGQAAACPRCDSLCQSLEKFSERVERIRRRSVPLRAELETIVRYPLTDLTAFLVLGAFVGGLRAIGFPVLPEGVLVMYMLHAVAQVGRGRFDDLTPLSVDFVTPLLLALATLIIALGPMFAALFLAPESPLFLLGIAWALVYTPVAVIVAGISRSFLQTLNPVTGLQTITILGSVYWEAMAIYLVLAVVQLVAGAVLGALPFWVVGPFLSGFVAGYLDLAIGCTLGLAVFKKAVELGLELEEERQRPRG